VQTPRHRRASTKAKRGVCAFMSWLLYYHQALTQRVAPSPSHSIRHTIREHKVRINNNSVITSSYMVTIQYRSHAIVIYRQA
jgi:hypothetical protein